MQMPTTRKKVPRLIRAAHPVPTAPPRDRDNYDRLLRLVWKARPDISGGLTEDILRESLNGRMLLDGYAVACIMDEEPWGDAFYRFQKEAMDSGAGLWADPGWIAHAAVNELIQ